MVQTGHMGASEVLTREKLLDLLSAKIKEIDFDLAKKDVEPFLKNAAHQDKLSLWSDAFFSDYLIHQINVLTT